MCGIVACKLKRKLTPSDIAKMDSLRDGLEHRGPDGFGSFVSEADGLYLGHRRLSIIGLDERGKQPMREDNLVITYNGEIYNYLEIAKELDERDIFNDTSVILKAWKKWGQQSLDKFDGMLAFALWDAETKKLTLATDIFGEKPLYQYENEDGYYYCSEAQPLIDLFSLKFYPTSEDITDFLNLGYIRPPSTGFKNLTNIGPASFLEIADNNQLTSSNYWSVPNMNYGGGQVHEISERQCEDIKDILCACLERRLRADVPIGLFLSGGVDSTLVAALASKELNQNIQTYTVAFPDGKDESEIAASIARHFTLDHNIINSRNSDLWKRSIDELCGIYGAPNDNMTALAVYQMCQSAKEHLTVALSGLGGDEIFYGYNKYEFLYQNRNFYRNSGVLERFSSVLKHAPVLGRKFDLLNKLMSDGKDNQYLRIKSGDILEDIQQLYSLQPKGLLGNNGADLVHVVREFDIRSSMPQSYIPAIDRGSMKASVEVRTPFLSRELIEYVSQLDQRALIAFGKKNVLKSILQSYMPLDLLYKGKQGFVFPASRYYAEMNPPKPSVPYVDQTVLDSLWNNKNDKSKQFLMTRLSVLSLMGKY